MRLKRQNSIRGLIVLEELLEEIYVIGFMFIFVMHVFMRKRYQSRMLEFRGVSRAHAQLIHLERLYVLDDTNCVEQLRMDRRTFGILCQLLRDVGLSDAKYVTLEEQVAVFLNILAHHTKNRAAKFNFLRSGQTISKHFNIILNGVLRLHQVLLKKPEPVSEDSTDYRWKWFKKCLGALDGTHIRMRVPATDKPRYRSRKGEISTNVLGVCSQDLKFIYVLPGWEGSAADSRVLRDAITRPNGLHVHEGYYYLVDAGYTNGPGFLAPYRGQPYHLFEWNEGSLPRKPKEFYNMKHSQARNVIERCFGLLKMRWAILRSSSFYPVRTQGRIILACCLLHNLIRIEMPTDPLEKDGELEVAYEEDEAQLIQTIEPSNAWSNSRDNLSKDMFNEWRASRGLPPYVENENTDN